jgi:hypothetical protein
MSLVFFDLVDVPSGGPVDGAQFSGWLMGYYIATYLLALVAIIGWWFSLRTSKKVTASLEVMESSLEVVEENANRFLEPLLKFVDYRWLVESDEMSCDNPPHGIMCSFANVSNVAIQVHTTDQRFFFGEQELAVEEEEGGRSFGARAPQIIPRGGTIQNGMSAQELPALLGQPKFILEPPLLAAHFTIEFARVNDDRRYRYKIIQNIGFDCSQPHLRSSFPTSEVVELVEP